MSILSGKCDLYDSLSFEVQHTKEGHPNVLYSDIMECFESFKKKTGGVLHQHRKVKVTTYNQDKIAELCNGELIINKHVNVVEDRRCKEGKKEVVSYTYTYWGKEYTLKELNKKEVWVTIDIKFETLLDLMPYLPYIVSASASDGEKSTVYISKESFVDTEFNDMLQFSGYNELLYNYRKSMSDLYREVVLHYFNPEGREVVEELEFDDDGLSKTTYPIDTNFDVEWRWADGKIHSHWTSPTVENDETGIISMSRQDLDGFIGNKCLVYYVKKGERKLYLD